MSTTTGTDGHTVTAPGSVPHPPTGELKGQDLAERKFARKLILPGLITRDPDHPGAVPGHDLLLVPELEPGPARGAQSFAGFDNYIAVVTNGAFLPSLWATVWIVGLSMILSMLLGLFFAILLDRKFRGQALARTLLITPFLIMPAAAALIWKYSILDTDSGIVTLVLSWFGLDGIAWTTDHPGLTIVFTLTWQYTPFMMLILLAGLQSQSGDILEAADVDGSNALQTFRYMTLPHLRTYAELAALLGTVLMVQVFDPVNIMTKGAGSTKTLPYLLYERAFIGQQIGEAAAYGVITVIVTIVLATLALRTVFKVFTEEAKG